MRRKLSLPVAAVAGILLSALLATGCGGGSSGVGTAHSLPSGFARYHANGFSFGAPAGMKATPNPLADLPAGSSSYILAPAEVPISESNTQIMEIVNPHLQLTVGEVATGLRIADSANSTLRNVHTSVRTVTVPGARAARVVSESYIGLNPPGVTPHAVQFKRTWLMVSPNPSTLLDLVVITEPQRGGTLDPNTVFHTFRLGG
jgi:hypothetical protein